MYIVYLYTYVCDLCATGISALPQEILPLLEQYNRIVLWFGNDQLHLNAARTFCEKLRRERCFFIK